MPVRSNWPAAIRRWRSTISSWQPARACDSSMLPGHDLAECVLPAYPWRCIGPLGGAFNEARYPSRLSAAVSSVWKLPQQHASSGKAVTVLEAADRLMARALPPRVSVLFRGRPPQSGVSDVRLNSGDHRVHPLPRGQGYGGALPMAVKCPPNIVSDRDRRDTRRRSLPKRPA